MDATVKLAMELIARRSITPEDGGCQRLIAERLARLGFHIEPMRFGEVANLWARCGEAPPLVVFAGHTDVVPAGPPSAWHVDPFQPEIRDDFLYGRGAADMKGSLAAMVTATERFLSGQRDHRGSLAFLLTSDEEGPAIDGTAKVVETLRARGETIDWCVIGEPTSEECIGDTIKIGRRGSLSTTLRIRGVQGHVAYPDRVVNPIHSALPVLSELFNTRWDPGNEHFPPTTFQITNVHAGTGVDNVVPAHIEISFNLRFSNHWSAGTLKERILAILNRHELRHDCDWRIAGEPFLAKQGRLLDAVLRAGREVTGLEARLSTSGGTSDGRFIAPGGTEVVELGPVNASIHKVDERVAVADLRTLSAIYERVLQRLLLEE
ncbi:MAG: succinyl-diaminopimelate desuccinylase [Gammaproteobacteria bacterium]